MITIGLPLSDERRFAWRVAMRERRVVYVDMAGLSGARRIGGVPVSIQRRSHGAERWEEWVLDDET